MDDSSSQTSETTNSSTSESVKDSKCWNVFYTQYVQIINEKVKYAICKKCKPIELEDKIYQSKQDFRNWVKKHFPNATIYVMSSSSTSNLNDHIKKNHLKNDESIKKYVQETVKHDITKSLADWLAYENLPFTTIESPKFKKVIHSYTYPSTPKIIGADMIRKYISNEFLKIRGEISQIIENDVSSCCLQTDIVKIKTTHYSFVGSAISFIDKNFNKHSLLLDFQKLEGSHSGQAIFELLKIPIQFFNLQSKIIATVSDSASNNGTMVEALEKFATECLFQTSSDTPLVYGGTESHIPCTADLVHNTALKALEHQDLEPIIQKCRELVSEIHRSSKARDSCRDFINAIPPIDVETRWNSTCIMLEFIVKHYSVFKTKFRFSVPEKKKNFIIEFLDIFKVITKAMSEEKTDISCVLPSFILMFNRIEEIIDKAIGKDFEFILKPAQASREYLKVKFQKTDSVLHYAPSTILNPFYKFSLFTEENGWNSIALQQTQEDIEGLIDKYEKFLISIDDDTKDIQEQDDKNDPQISTLQKIFLKIIPVENQNRFNGAKELKKYLLEPRTLSNPLSFWRANREYYPILSKMAHDLFSIDPSSVFLERIYSNCPDLVTTDRSSVTPETIEQCMLYRYYTKFLEKYKNNNFNI